MTCRSARRRGRATVAARTHVMVCAWLSGGGPARLRVNVAACLGVCARVCHAARLRACKRAQTRANVLLGAMPRSGGTPALRGAPRQ
eukprot:11103251-Lingulodinium_polyedra.AAC.1